MTSAPQMAAPLEDNVPAPPPATAGVPLLTLDGVRLALNARTWWDADLSTPVAGVVAADLMSDVLVGSRPGQVLLTSLVTLLTVRTAALVDFSGVVFVRGKEPRPDVVASGREQRIPPAMREMGFGAGMGLPNMKRVSDAMSIDSVVREGTRVRMRFNMEVAGV